MSKMNHLTKSYSIMKDGKYYTEAGTFSASASRAVRKPTLPEIKRVQASIEKDTKVVYS